MKRVTECETVKSFVDYLEVVPFPSKGNICKWYTDMILEMAEELGVDYIFAHSDKAICCKMVLIHWLNEKKYDKVVNHIGGLHTLMVKLKIMYKKYDALGFREWWVDAGVIAVGSSVQAVEGKHYIRNLGLHKESFEALLRYCLNNEVNMDQFGDSFKECISALRKKKKSSKSKIFDGTERIPGVKKRAVIYNRN